MKTKKNIYKINEKKFSSRVVKFTLTCTHLCFWTVNKVLYKENIKDKKEETSLQNKKRLKCFPLSCNIIKKKKKMKYNNNGPNHLVCPQT